MCSKSNLRKCSVHVPLHFCYSCTHDCNAVIQTCAVCIHYAEDDDDDEGDEYYVFSPSKVTAGRNTSSVDIDDANNDDDDDPEHDYLKLIPSVSSNQK